MTWIEIYSQKWGNEAFIEIQSAGLDVNQFRREPWPPSIKITHEPTKGFFAFGDELGGTAWSVPGYPGKTSQTGRGMNTPSPGWDKKIFYFKTWLKDLKDLLVAVAEYRATPDLWSSTRSEIAVFERFGAAGLENRPFTLEEQKYVAAQLQELKTFITRTGQIEESKLVQIEARLRYLAEASTRMGRKDWLGILIATIFAIVISGLFAPERANELLGFAAALFESLYGFVSHLALPA
jgi:hypothetical protein